MQYAIYIGFAANEIGRFASYSKKVFETKSLAEFKRLVTLLEVEPEFKFLSAQKTGVVTSMTPTFRTLTAKEIKEAKLPAAPKLLKAAKDSAARGVALMIER